MKVKITKTDIKKGNRGNGRDCALALGIRRASGGHVRVHDSDCIIDGIKYRLPKIAIEFRENFDASKHDVGPIEFEISGNDISKNE